MAGDSGGREPGMGHQTGNRTCATQVGVGGQSSSTVPRKLNLRNYLYEALRRILYNIPHLWYASGPCQGSAPQPRASSPHGKNIKFFKVTDSQGEQGRATDSLACGLMSAQSWAQSAGEYECTKQHTKVRVIIASRTLTPPPGCSSHHRACRCACAMLQTLTDGGTP